MIKTKVTPVRYPGGKSNALKFLKDYFPHDFKEYREPFFGGGSVGLYLMQLHKHTTYHINDLFYPVYCFWKTLYNEPERMINFIMETKNTYRHQSHVPEIIEKGIPSKSAENGRVLHKNCRDLMDELIEQKDEFVVGCYWYILNKTSYSGMAMIGSYAPLAWDQNFTDNCIKNLRDTAELMHSVYHVEITNKDYSELLSNDGDDVFIFLDPPYKIVHNLYGNKGDMHEGFDHKLFADKVKACNHRWMITYNEDPEIQNWFEGNRQKTWDLQYTMKAAKRDGQDGSTKTGKSGKQGKELLVWNYE